jgi:hypothetical protein
MEALPRDNHTESVRAGLFSLALHPPYSPPTLTWPRGPGPSGERVAARDVGHLSCPCADERSRNWTFRWLPVHSGENGGRGCGRSCPAGNDADRSLRRAPSPACRRHSLVFLPSPPCAPRSEPLAGGCDRRSIHCHRPSVAFRLSSLSALPEHICRFSRSIS